MTKQETLSILKLASKFGDKKDMRPFCQQVQIVHDHINDLMHFYCSNGHVAIKVTRKGTAFECHSELPNQATIESIEKAHKVKDYRLLELGDIDLRFPAYNKVFDVSPATELQAVHYDSKYLALIFTALETFRKELKIKLCKVLFNPIQADKAHIMTVFFNKDLTDEIKNEIALMPLKY